MNLMFYDVSDVIFVLFKLCLGLTALFVVAKVMSLAC